MPFDHIIIPYILSYEIMMDIVGGKQKLLKLNMHAFVYLKYKYIVKYEILKGLLRHSGYLN